MAMQLSTNRIDNPDATNFILGRTHFIKSVEDIHETLVGAVPGIKFARLLRGFRQMLGAKLRH
jgi:adenosine/AMP kinase